MTKETGSAGMDIGTTAVRGAKQSEGVRLKNLYHVECRGKDGKLKWIEEFGNRVVDVGLTDLIDTYTQGSTYSADHYVGLTSTTPAHAADDTMASKAWSEVVAYGVGARPAYVPVSGAAGVVDNSGTPAAFDINADTTVIGGAFICTNGTKGETASTLYSVGAFTGGDKSLDDGDQLNVTVSLSVTP